MIRALVLLAVWLLAASARAIEPTVFWIHACNTDGTGFLATGIPDADTTSVVTALHVAGGCKLLELRSLSCQEDAPVGSKLDDPDLELSATSPVIAWFDLDVVAFPVVPDPNWVAVELAAEGTALRFNSAVRVMGSDDFNACPRGMGNVRDTPRASRLIDQLKNRTRFTAADLGGLAPSAPLIIMASTGGPGVSGGPVLDDRLRLVGLYQGGGTSGYSTNWAVRLSRADLVEFRGVVTTLDKLERTRAARLTASAANDYAIHAEGSTERPTGAYLAGSVSGFRELGSAGASGGILELIGYAPFSPRYNTSWGGFATLGYAWGETDQIYFGPVGERIVARTSSRFSDYFLTAGLGVRGWQQYWVRLGAAATYRIGGRVVRDTPAEEDRATLLHGAGLHLFPCVSLTRQLAGCLDASAAYLHTERQEYRITLGEPAALPTGAGWYVAGALGISLTWGLWAQPMEFL